MADSNLDGVLLGGALALFGALIGALLTFVDHAFERAHRKKEILRQKYEELAGLIDETIQWFPALDSCTSAEAIRAAHLPVCARRLATLALVYFPELKKTAQAYSNGLVDYYEWAAECFLLFDSELPAGDSLDMHPEAAARFELIDKQRHALEAEVERYAKKYTAA